MNEKPEFPDHIDPANDPAGRIPEEGVDFDLAPTGMRGADSDAPILGRKFRPGSPFRPRTRPADVWAWVWARFRG